MNNYHYIVSSLPVISPDYKFTDSTPAAVMEEILEQLSEKDKAVVEFVEKGFVSEELNADYYRTALTHSDSFVRSYFGFDLNVRNAKVAYLNEQIGRPAGKDILDINLDEDAPQIEVPEFEEAQELENILRGGDILSRERGIDVLTWNKIDSLTTFDYFDLDAILGFITKLHIVNRWFVLDEQTGREMFKKLVNEIRGTFKGVQYNPETK